MRRLVWGFAGRTYHIVVNLMHWLITYRSDNNKYIVIWTLNILMAIDFNVYKVKLYQSDSASRFKFFPLSVKPKLSAIRWKNADYN